MSRADDTAAGDSVDDRTLLARHVDGDRDAFATLVERHRDRLWRVALRTLGDAEDAADAVQDGLLSAYRNAAGFRGEAAVGTWLHRIVVNACLDLVRRRTSRPTVPLDPEAHAGSVDDVGDRVEAMDLLAALRRLPADHAAAVVLVDVEGRPVAEVADILEIPVGTVKSRCARARARLAAMLTGPDGNPAAGLSVEPAMDAGDEQGGAR